MLTSLSHGRRAAIAAVVLGFAALGASCGGDDDAATSTTTCDVGRGIDDKLRCHHHGDGTVDRSGDDRSPDDRPGDDRSPNDHCADDRPHEH